MEQDVEPLDAASDNQSLRRLAAAQRMRLYRERRRLKLRCLTIQLRESEIDALVRKALLRPDMRNEPREVRKALYAHLDRTLGQVP